jgi:integrase
MAKGKPRRANDTGTVYKLKGNRSKPWAAQVRGPRKTVEQKDENGEVKRRSKRTWITLGFYRTKKEAEKALAIQFIMPVSNKSRIRFCDLFEEWKTGHYKRVGPQAAKLYNGAYRILEPVHNKIFADIRTAQYQIIFDASDKSHSYKHSTKSLLGMMYKYAMENDICYKNYAQFIKLDSQEKKEIVVFTDAEIKKLFDNEAVPGVDMILMLIYSGFRIQEFLNLTVFDVDLEAGTITGGLKTESGKNRVVPIHPKVSKHWKKYVAASSGRLFTHRGSPLTQSQFRKRYYYPALEQRDIERKTPHKCRDTFATLLARSSADTLAIQQMMGHSNYSFTANHYTAKNVGFLSENIQKIK